MTQISANLAVPGGKPEGFSKLQRGSLPGWWMMCAGGGGVQQDVQRGIKTSRRFTHRSGNNLHGLVEPNTGAL